VIPVKAVPNYFPRPPLNECHHYDLITKRKALTPFEECDIVRLEVSRRRILNQPLDKIPGSLIIGMLVNQDIPVEKIEKRLAMKGISDAPIFSLL
jgi:hypothetical protein